ncbi:phytoene desaturase family protein [Alkalicoccus chagannorensis]|uniref:phytoene desaturase family protein n=1 Tax=Alkalicoccus chagannorensis TaxID=427072 RepID=UPI00040B3F75|nr:phytoene desaturase family protein [Alkalicoccus chagannorensis]
MKTVVAGAGIGGMVSALYEQQRGAEVTVIEAQERPGGRLSSRSEHGFKIDAGPTVVLLPEMIQSVLGDLGLQDRVDMIRVDPLYPVHFADGTTLMKWSDPVKQREEIERFAPGESIGFDLYMKDMRERFHAGKPAFLDNSFHQKSTFWTKSNVQTLMKLKAYASVYRQAASYFQNEKLRQAFSLQTLYIGGSPDRTPAIYSLVPFSEHEHGIWYVKGGFAALGEMLAEAMEERGITLKLNTRVHEVEQQNGRATALRTTGGRFAADRVIVNGDFPMIEKTVQKPRRSYEPSSGCLLIYLGLKELPETRAPHNFFLGADHAGHMDAVFQQRAFVEKPSFYFFLPSMMDETLAPPGKASGYILIPVPPASADTEEAFYAYADRIREEIFSRIHPDFASLIEWEEWKTPHDAEREGMFDGGSFGIAPVFRQSGVFRPQLKPFRLSNVYAVGASVHPGGGVPIVMQGARLLSRLILEEEVKAWA